jgi:sigma 54 modulation/S30EA-like ribosomal protein
LGSKSAVCCASVMVRSCFRVTCVPVLRAWRTRRLLRSLLLRPRGDELRRNVVVFRGSVAFIGIEEAYPPTHRGIVQGMFFATLLSRPAILSPTKMQIRVDVDDHIDGSEELMVRVEGVVEGSLDGYQERVTRVDVHLSRRIPYRHGEHDMCCRMDAHAGGRPISVSHEAITLTEAIHAASAKLERAVQLALQDARASGTGREEEENDEAPGQAEGLEHLRSS